MTDRLRLAAQALVDEVDKARDQYLRQFPPKTGTEWHLIARDHPSIVALRRALAEHAEERADENCRCSSTEEPLPCKHGNACSTQATGSTSPPALACDPGQTVTVHEVEGGKTVTLTNNGKARILVALAQPAATGEGT